MPSPFPTNIGKNEPSNQTAAEHPLGFLPNSIPTFRDCPEKNQFSNTVFKNSSVNLQAC